jgi:hypothetical protein
LPLDDHSGSAASTASICSGEKSCDLALRPGPDAGDFATEARPARYLLLVEVTLLDAPAEEAEERRELFLHGRPHHLAEALARVVRHARIVELAERLPAREPVRPDVRGLVRPERFRIERGLDGLEPERHEHREISTERAT